MYSRLASCHAKNKANSGRIILVRSQLASGHANVNKVMDMLDTANVYTVILESNVSLNDKPAVHSTLSRVSGNVGNVSCNGNR